ncbi:Spo0E family sporulation regulatory protein-aspartic acid phosphatase [Sulfoacidibacillus thermotolerans]|uniref:Spo0E family sporulation regulatory protein-aspartic acid phosphatase n=1 Tax=Sulfoacidibacillus thermotolerans TaxID=1765684 RepID=A0A2U3DBA4_SULT2|nr:Spo0E family sporulation regulatory protein-aspartic acid phosphatase [Sulfoacidibacillus thermotolerans]PWI58545.1 hypothetical protein BM613_03245 [Sulfoacidibacillus thermotolerans]
MIEHKKTDNLYDEGTMLLPYHSSSQEMWLIRKAMEEHFARHGNLQDPIIIQLSSQLDRLVVAEMRKHQTGRRTTEVPPPSRR